MPPGGQPAVIGGVGAHAKGDTGWQADHAVVPLAHRRLAFWLVKEGQGQTQTTLDSGFGDDDGDGQETASLLEQEVAEVELTVFWILELALGQERPT